MKSAVRLSLALLVVNTLARAAVPVLPTIPTNQYNVLNYGAYGDGNSNCTAAIQAAISAAAGAGGGTVVIPANGTLSTYLSNPLALANKINLRIDSGAMLKALPMAQFTSTDHFIYAAGVSDVEISGSGTIDGNGADWWEAFANDSSISRPYMIYFNGNCHRVLMQDVTLQNPPKMHLVFKGADDNITIQRILINTTTEEPYPAKNTDGIDLVGNHCLVQNCVINSGDDNIALGSSSGSAVSTDILITNCTFGVGHGVSIGSNTAGGVSNLTVTSCSFDGTDYGIRMKSDDRTSGGSGQGGVAQNLTYSNITMTNIVYGAIVLYSYYKDYGTPTSIDPSTAASQTVGSVLYPIWRNITISNVTASVADGGIAGIIWGRKEVPFTNVVLHSVNITAPSSFDIYNAQGVQLINSYFTIPGTNTLNLYNAEVTITNSTAVTNLVTLGGLASPLTNNVLTFFNAQAAVAEASMLGAGSITLGNSTLAFIPDSVSFSNSLSVADDSTLVFASGNNAFSGALSGSGALTLSLLANSRLSLQGNSSGYAGNVTVSNGTLLVDNTAGSGTGAGAVTVLTGATLGGDGIVGGPVTVNGTLAPGDGPGTLAIGNNLALSDAAELQYGLGTNSDLAAVGGNLTLDGTLNITDTGGFTNGTYTLFTYGGMLTTNGSRSILRIGATPSPNLDYVVDISSIGHVNLIVTVPCYTLSATNASFGAAGGNGTVSVTASTDACSWTAYSNDDWIQIAGGSVSATGSAVVAYTVLPTTSSSTRTGTMTLGNRTFTVTQAGDAEAPSVALTSPTSGIVSNTIVVSATATDNGGVAKVDFYRDGGILLDSVSSPPYSVSFNTIAAGDGLHCFYAEAYDAANNVSSSATNCVIVVNHPPSVPKLTATSVSTNEIDLSWTPAIDAGAGVAGYYLFRGETQIAVLAGTNYSDSGLAGATEYCYRVSAFDNIGRASARSAEACEQTFTTLEAMLGTYNGLVIQTNAPSPASSGSVRFVVRKGGAFAAKLAIGGTRVAFGGQFDAAGNATNSVARRGLDPLEIVLHLDLAGTDQITGTVSNNTFTSELLADRATVYSGTNRCPWAGRFAVVLEPPEGADLNVPQGFGYGTLTVAASGRGRLTGALGDGAKVHVTVPVSKYGTWPLYEPLYKSQGASIGWVTFDTNGTAAATVDWFRPAAPASPYYPDGFATNVTLTGQEYVPPPPLNSPSGVPNRQITLGGGDLASDIVGHLYVFELGNVVVLPPNSDGLQIRIDPATGIFRGSFKHPGLGKTIHFKGSAVDFDGLWAGCFLGADSSGYVIVEPSP
ncbi:MAG TPA: glycosyl hydrolase family 28 protein [Verrucomicrobiae bacterium]|nr:glycosyl hydrolase family 28 protein [Verrucomicrobiae bacterium]